MAQPAGAQPSHVSAVNLKYHAPNRHTLFLVTYTRPESPRRGITFEAAVITIGDELHTTEVLRIPVTMYIFFFCEQRQGMAQRVRYFSYLLVDFFS